MHVRMLLLLVTALALAACGGDGAPDATPPDDSEDGATDDAGDDPADGADPDDGSFDRAEAEAEAEALLGTPESEITEDADTRIMRRGDEQFAGTMDLRPGRRNLELDDDGSGTYVVTRVEVEVPEGEDPIVVE